MPLVLGADFAAGLRARRLSGRELEIVTRLAHGKRVPAIATELYLTQGTVRNQLSSVYRKLGIGSQQELLDMINADISSEAGGRRRRAPSTRSMTDRRNPLMERPSGSVVPQPITLLCPSLTS